MLFYMINWIGGQILQIQISVPVETSAWNDGLSSSASPWYQRAGAPFMQERITLAKKEVLQNSR